MKLSKLIIRLMFRNYKKSKPKNIYKKISLKRIEKLFLKNKKEKNLILATQVGRSGGKWLCDILNTINRVSAYGERNAKVESIFRYKKSFNLKDYDNEILKIIKTEILSDWKNNDLSYISSPYFSHGIATLNKKLNPKKIVILIASPIRVLTSLKNKGWYEIQNKQNTMKPHSIKIKTSKLTNHYFGRMINFGKYNKNFNSFSQIEKIALFMSLTLKKIYKEISKIDKNKIEIFYLDQADQNYNYCKKFIKKLGYKLSISKKEFLGLKKRTANQIENKKISIPKIKSDNLKNFINQYTSTLKKIRNLKIN